ncbi:ParB/RepB/Spo0J family partition protein [Streptomyces spiramyceticus]|uniref:ParB/RepB/Spo0J family partition protein n=1 Tax=Streptomyces spiramyceticus TaxID=299717 RepID=UPI003084392F
MTVASVDAYLQERPDRAADIEAGACYIVVDGHRRLEAARLAGATTIRVSVDNARVSTDESLLEDAFVANVHRDDMSPLEQAQACARWWTSTARRTRQPRGSAWRPVHHLVETVCTRPRPATAGRPPRRPPQDRARTQPVETDRSRADPASRRPRSRERTEARQRQRPITA